MFELVLIIKLEISSHHRFPSLRPARLVIHNLAGTSEVAFVPIHELLFDPSTIQQLAPLPRSHAHRHVRCRESVQKCSLWHRQATFPRQEEELESDPCANRVAPDNVRNTIINLIVEDGQQQRTKSILGIMHRHFHDLVTTRVIHCEHLYLLALLDPLEKDCARARVSGLGASSVVEADDAQLGILQRASQDLVLGAEQEDVACFVMFRGFSFDLRLQLLIDWNGSGFTWSTYVLLLGHHELLAADFEADPALLWAGAIDQLVVQTLADELHFFDGGTSGETLRTLR
mmetsp:Transcript_46951/g.84887  ORF Transcript_46951/g.84887 Transcript_46951/m.84887 type:complete len:287 (+) Transcript_46951:326-1186(+)